MTNKLGSSVQFLKSYYLNCTVNIPINSLLYQSEFILQHTCKGAQKGPSLKRDVALENILRIAIKGMKMMSGKCFGFHPAQTK